MGTNGAARKGLPPGNDEDTIKVVQQKKEKNGNGTIKLKRPAPKHTKPGNWRDGSVIDEDKKKSTSTPTTNTSSPAPPVVNQLDDHARDTFPTGRPMEDALEHLSCKHCKKSFLKNVITQHLVECLSKKREKAQKKKEQKEAREREKKEAERGAESDGEEGSGEEVKGAVKGMKKSAGKKIEGEEKKGKKRKADGEGEKGPSKKKKKEELKIKAPKAKGPVDVERQCGVLKDGVACARSLTCKSHSMGAKRAVPGRSLPYDMLLAAYQKKNQAKQQKAAIDANAPLEDEDAGAGPVDSDEELTAVMHGLSNWNPQPVVPPLVHIPIETVYKRQRLYEQLHSATNGFSVNIFKVVGLGAQRLPPNGDEENVERGGDEMKGLINGMQNVAQRRASGFNMQLPPQRRQSGQLNAQRA